MDNNKSIEAEKSDGDVLENNSSSRFANNNSINYSISLDFSSEIKSFSNILRQCVVGENNKLYFKCKNCQSIFLLVFIKDYYFVKCNCKQINFTQSKNDENIIKNYKNEIESDNQLEDNSILFPLNFYTCYCKDCNIDLDDKSKNDHVEHLDKVINYQKLNADDDIKIIKELLLNENKNNNIRYKVLNKDGVLKFIIELITNDFYMLKCYNLIQSIKNIVDYFNIKVYSIAELEGYIEQAKSNKKKEQLFEKHFSDIRIIHLEGSDNNNILEKLCCNELKDKLGNIIQLTLMNCNLNNIKPLLKVDLPNLETLNLKSNKLRDDIINVLENLNAPNLKDLSLENNNLKDYLVFRALQHFKFLQKVDLGSNGFTIEKININNLNNISLQSITELWVSNGVFDDDTIDQLFKFALKNLEILKLNGSYLNYKSLIKILSFIRNLGWKKLKELHLNNNNIIVNIADEINQIINGIQIEMQLTDPLIIELNDNELKENDENKSRIIISRT